MTPEEVKYTTERYFNTVLGKPITKELPEHLIIGFNVKVIAGSLHVFVLAENKSHYIKYIEKSLEDWLNDNNEY